ncbi:tetratricopeptide repeat protein [Pelagibacterium xiamenense]|uniref:tetratricopeptide repeat protein n=1 Tax=Pelagibacterium xiamenense TaxID=2901140 RepID=UPI001E62D132|nr:tetratricopeptide repeat protein [Pelagibacterium xiamenense]MCD7059757.1 tetratricopeptide repeat protein [Pelagibacterium xiamenense]
MSDDSFLREVEEELRSDKMRAFWRKYAPFIIGAAVLIVVVVAANEAWNWWRASTAAAASDRYYAAVNLAVEGDYPAAEDALAAIVEDGPRGYAVLAQFRQGSVQRQQGDAAGALATYDALSSSLDSQRLRELALILAGYTAVDTGTVADVETRVGGLNTAQHPMRNLAREALGLAYYKAGEYGDARARFEEIAADPNASQDMQVRAMVYLEQLAAVGADVSEEILPAVEASGAPEPAATTEQTPAQ